MQGTRSARAPCPLALYASPSRFRSQGAMGPILRFDDGVGSD